MMLVRKTLTLQQQTNSHIPKTKQQNEVFKQGDFVGNLFTE